MIKNILFSISLFLSTQASAGDKIKYYFNHPVDNTVSTGTDAVYLNQRIGDTLIAYINRAKYTLDIAVYHFQSSQSVIATAINNAYARGVAVRWIYDGDSPSSNNSGLPLLNAAINTLPSPQTSAYTIMHNKFMVVDANSSDPNDAIVWTGSSNWNSQQFKYDYNNYVIIQDAPLAKAYLAEFNMMWGGTGIAPNLSASKFGQYKTDLGAHDFTIDGKHVELYFSPSDHTNNHIQSTITSADKDIYVGMYTFTNTGDASMLAAKHDNGVYVAVIEDVSSQSSSPYSILLSDLTSSNIKIYDGPGSDIYHSKYMIVDQSDKCSDPTVLTGSHNWSYDADTKNDENTLIIHDDVAANIYYQAFKSDFAAMGGTLTPVNGCTSGIADPDSKGASLSVSPNPSSDGRFTINYSVPSSENVTIEVYNIIGQKIATPLNLQLKGSGVHSADINIGTPGMYFLRLTTGAENLTQRIVVSK
jgi:hypothetical protein